MDLQDDTLVVLDGLRGFVCIGLYPLLQGAMMPSLDTMQNREVPRPFPTFSPSVNAGHHLEALYPH